MKIKKADSKKASRLIGFYMKMGPRELKMINVKWAVGDKINHILNDFEDYSFFYVNLEELIKKVDFGEMGFKKMNPNELFTDVDVSNFRIAKILKQWRNGGYIDPPSLCLDSFNKLYISDGRHRTIGAFHLGETNIPVAVPSSLVKDVSMQLDLK